MDPATHEPETPKPAQRTGPCSIEGTGNREVLMRVPYCIAAIGVLISVAGAAEKTRAGHGWAKLTTQQLGEAQPSLL